MSSQTTSKCPRPPLPRPVSVQAPPLSPPALPPAKQPKKARKLSSPPAPSPAPPVAAPSLEVPPLPLKNGNKQADKSTRDRGVSGAVLDNGPSVFDVLNVFRHRWFLHQDHLLANILSAQKDDASNIVWVDFLPPFHTHLVRRAFALLPPLCPEVKGKKVMFVFLLEVIAREGPTTFFDLPKKRMLTTQPRSPVIWQAQVASSLATLPPAASLAPSSAKINISYSILFHLTTSYSSYLGGKKGISRNKTSFFLLMFPRSCPSTSMMLGNGLKRSRCSPTRLGWLASGHRRAGLAQW